MAPTESRATALRLVVTFVVLAGAYVGLCVWSSQHVPSSVSVGGIQVGGMSPEGARAAIDRGSRSLLATPITVTVPGTETSFEVVPSQAGLGVDADRSLDGLTGFTLDPRTVWDRLTGSVELPLLTHADDDQLTAYLTALAPKVASDPVEGSVSFPEGKVTIDLPEAGRTLDVAGTKLALRRAFPDDVTAQAAVRRTPPKVSAEAVQAAAADFGERAMSGPIVVTAGPARAAFYPPVFAPAVSMEADGSGALEPKFDEKKIAAMVGAKLKVNTRPARNAHWVFVAGRPKLVPSVDGVAVDEAALTTAVASAMTSPSRTVAVKAVFTKPPFTTADAVKAGVKDMVVDFKSPFPLGDVTRTNNLVVAARTINGHYLAPGATFSLNAILGERTTAKGYKDGTVIINGRLTRGTGGGVSQVSTTMYNLAYFAGADILEFTPHAFFIPRYPEGREATVFWPNVDNKFKNDTPYGMLIQTWVENGFVRGRVWSTKVWDIKSVKGPRRNVVQPRDIVDGSLTCYPQQPNPGFDVTVTRQFYRKGSGVLVKSEPVTTHYIPEHHITCSNPKAKP